MCGINGYFQYSSQLNIEQIQTVIKRMNDRIIHRGPDDDGIFLKENLGLGMRRLSIIDLNTGNQPIFNEDKTLVIVFNGEVYNYKALKDTLLAKGHIFYTTSDTEVVLHCYEEYGHESFNKLKGMFAFAIYDLKNKKLIVVRDRAGEKPLYYYNDSNVLLFASELKSLISTGIISKKINTRALNQYLQLTYIPAPLTIYENVLKLLPGHFMEIDCHGATKVHSYWDVEYLDNELITDFELCKSTLRNTMFNAVEESMVSDVPIGAFLSGGIDSSTIVGIMGRISNRPIETFTIGFKDRQYDESARAQISAIQNHTNHHTYYLEYEDALPELETIFNNMDEPFADSSILPTYMVSKYASQYVKTVLTGDAGDELFGGYSKYLIGHYSLKYNNLPQPLRTLIKGVVYTLPDKTSLTRKMRKVIENSNQSTFEQRRNMMCLGFKNIELAELMKRKTVDTESLDFIYDYYSNNDTHDELSHALYTDFKVVLEGDMLAKVDRAGMLNSLETRVPMLHKDVVETASKIPSWFKIDSRRTKIILKETFKDLIPSELLMAGKRGFEVPIGNWFQNELRKDLLSEIERDRIEEEGIFNYSYIDRTMREHFTHKKNRSSELWGIYVFQKWYHRHFENKLN